MEFRFRVDICREHGNAICNCYVVVFRGENIVEWNEQENDVPRIPLILMRNGCHHDRGERCENCILNFSYFCDKFVQLDGTLFKNNNGDYIGPEELREQIFEYCRR